VNLLLNEGLLDALISAHKLFKIQMQDRIYDIVSNAIRSTKNENNKGCCCLCFLLCWNRVWYEKSEDGRRAWRNLDVHLSEIIRAIRDIDRLLGEIEDKCIYEINFSDTKVRRLIEIVYDRLAKIVGYTGASKVLHLLYPNVFVMWDERIRSAYSIQAPTSDNYVNFLVKIQEIIKRLINEYANKYGVNERNARLKLFEIFDNYPITKIVDEYNFLKFTKNEKALPLIIPSKEIQDKLLWKLTRIKELIDDLVNEALKAASIGWVVRTKRSGMVRASARKLQGIVHEYIKQRDLNGLMKYLENALADATGREVAKILRACNKKTLEDIYPIIVKIIKDDLQ